MIVTIGIVCSMIGVVMELFGRHIAKKRTLKAYKMVDDTVIELPNESIPETLPMWFRIVKGGAFFIGLILIFTPILA